MLHTDATHCKTAVCNTSFNAANNVCYVLSPTPYPIPLISPQPGLEKIMILLKNHKNQIFMI